MTTIQITQLFGWSLVINSGLLLFMATVLLIMNKPISKLHSKIFGINEADLPKIYFNILAIYKLIIAALNLVPYVILKMIV